MKRLVLIFCMDGNAGKALAETIRNEDTTAQLRSADGVDLHFRIEDCDSVVIMPDVPGWKRRVLEKVYAGFVVEANPAPAEVTMSGYELQGSGYDPGAAGFELQGRAEQEPRRKPGRPRKDAA